MMFRMLIVAPIAFLFACQSGPRTADDVGTSEAELIDVVSFETGCPSEQIDIVDESGDAYDVLACGEMLTYTQTNEIFHEM